MNTRDRDTVYFDLNFSQQKNQSLVWFLTKGNKQPIENQSLVVIFDADSEAGNLFFFETIPLL